MHEHGIVLFELVVVNLYPFEATIAKPNVTMKKRPSRSTSAGRAGARGGEESCLVGRRHSGGASTQGSSSTSPNIQGTDLETKRRLADSAFDMTARYDRAIADYFAGQRPDESGFPASLPLHLWLAA